MPPTHNSVILESAEKILRKGRIALVNLLYNYILYSLEIIVSINIDFWDIKNRK